MIKDVLTHDTVKGGGASRSNTELRLQTGEVSYNVEIMSVDGFWPGNWMGKSAKVSGCKSNLQGRPSSASSALVNAATTVSSISLAGSS